MPQVYFKCWFGSPGRGGLLLSGLHHHLWGWGLSLPNCCEAWGEEPTIGGNWGGGKKN